MWCTCYRWRRRGTRRWRGIWRQIRRGLHSTILTASSARNTRSCGNNRRGISPCNIRAGYNTSFRHCRHEVRVIRARGREQMIDKSLMRGGNIISQKFEHFLGDVRRRHSNLIMNGHLHARICSFVTTAGTVAKVRRWGVLRRCHAARTAVTNLGNIDERTFG